MDCLKELIAITQNDCPCVIGNVSEETKALLTYGKSGLSLDDLEENLGLASLQYVDDCKDFSKICLDARETATKKLEADLMLIVNSKYGKSKQKFIGEIGRMSYTSTLQLNKDYSFIRLRPKAKNSEAILTLKSIRLITTESAPTTLFLVKAYRDNLQGEIFKEIEIEARAGSFVEVSTENMELPLVLNGLPVDYFIVWKREGSMNTRDNSLSCNCGGLSYETYLEVSGGSTDNINELGGKLDGLARGLSVSVEIECKAGNVICKEFDKEDAVALTIAWALLYRTGISLVTSILSSNEVNRYTMLKKEHLMGIRNHYTKEYNTRLSWLKENINITDSECFVCRDNSLFMTQILL